MIFQVYDVSGPKATLNTGLVMKYNKNRVLISTLILVERYAVPTVYDHFSACGIIEEAKPHRIREGDLVTKS